MTGAAVTKKRQLDRPTVGHNPKTGGSGGTTTGGGGSTTEGRGEEGALPSVTSNASIATWAPPELVMPVTVITIV